MKKSNFEISGVFPIPIFHTYLERELTNEELTFAKNQINDAKDDTQVYITQSWINYNEENQYHHLHSHPNSYISGVFYINADEHVDSINFNNKEHLTIQPVTKKFNIWNSKNWWFPVKKRMLVLFPSSTNHNVFQKKDSDLRISLAFNTFVRGNIGSNIKLNELKL